MPLSPDHNAERLAKLKELMPDIFTNEGKLNMNELKKVVDPELVNETERYEFRWFGKSKAKREAFTPTDATLVYDEDRSVNPDNSENIIIEGENLAVLKLLSKSYREKVKCIYIDPPYNTGKDFVYTDKWNQDKAEYWEDAEYVENGMKVDTNVETDGRFHSNWLNMMYSRLLIARQLLKEDGVIFISIDDREVYHLRKLCNEIFGEENFVSLFNWQKKVTRENRALISVNHEYVLCFSKNFSLIEEAIDLLPMDEEAKSRYKNPDEDSRGVWTSVPAIAQAGHGTKSQFYSFKTPSGRTVEPPSGNCWRYTEEKMQAEIKDNRIWFGSDGNGVPRIKKFLNEGRQGLTPLSLLFAKQVGTTDSAKREMTKLFDGTSVFDTPKPSTLIKHLAEIGAGENELFLDFFSGSGPSGHAITEMNLESKKSIKYILVQLPEATDPKSEAYKAGYKKISDITIERNKRVIDKIIKEKKAEQPDLFTGDKKEDSLNGLGFKVFKLQKSNFPRTEFAPDPEKSEEENVELLKKYIRDKEAQMVTAFNKEELITEILIKKGYELNYTVTKKEEFKKNELFHVTDGIKETLICLDGSLDKETVEYFKQNPKENLIVLERALDTTKKWNLKHYMGDNFVAF